MKINSLEKQVDTILKKLGFCDIFLPQFSVENYILDFAEPDNKIAIEVQGNYWHKKPKQKIKDKIKKRILEENGWKIIYIWERTLKRNSQKTKEYLNIEILKRIII